MRVYGSLGRRTTQVSVVELWWWFKFQKTRRLVGESVAYTRSTNKPML